MLLSEFLKKYQVSRKETEIALRVYSDVDMAENEWKDELQNSLTLNKKVVVKEKSQSKTSKSEESNKENKTTDK